MNRICTICGEPFEPSHHNQTRCKGPHYSECPVCGKKIPWKPYTRCCSNKCTQELKIRTCLERYGVKSAQQLDAVKEKFKKTCRERYGVDAPFQLEQIRETFKQNMLQNYGYDNPLKVPEFKQKAAETNLKRYGFKSPTQSEDIKKKIKSTCLERYGVDNPAKVDAFKEKIKKTCLKKYGVDTTLKVPEIREKQELTKLKRYGCKQVFSSSEIRKNIEKTNLSRYGVPWYCMTEDCKRLNGRIISTVNVKFSEFLKSKDIDYEMEFILENRSYDFKVGNVLLEIDPTISHNSHIHIFTGTLIEDPNPNAQFLKTELAEKHGYRCIHIFDWDNWDDVIDLLSGDYSGAYTIKDNLIYCDLSKSSGSELENHILKKVVDPFIVWSKKDLVLEDVDDSNNDNLLDTGWLPIYNCGYKIFEMRSDVTEQ